MNDPEVHQQNKRGQYVPSIPLPFYLPLSVRCGCGKKFSYLHPFGLSAVERYREHYAYAHILGLEH